MILNDIATGYWNLLFKDEDLEPLARQRVETCLNNTCGKFSPFAGGWCKQCKCKISAKARCVKCKCPQKLW